ncbi:MULTISPECIES: BtpA/SgcQ family protein [Microbacterium]|uniref:BtpA/SgcQ family protein n=1 Tax=Microbacterium TaxID=33882 RepID=UPI003F9D78D0
MTSLFRDGFPGVDRPLIAMAHVPALPGTPLYDAAGGVDALVDHVRRDVELLVDAGFDAVMFCNENDRPYQLHAGPESSAVMARVVTECRPSTIPFGVDFLWDPRIALATAVATGASFMREVVTGVWESDMGLWNTDAAETLRERRRLDAEGIAILMNIAPEFASPIGTRGVSQIAKSTVVSSLADAILVSGPMAGQAPEASALREVREAVPEEIPVLLNTGARAETIADMLAVADGCIVGSSLKADGYTWNPVDAERARRFVEAARG